MYVRIKWVKTVKQSGIQEAFKCLTIYPSIYLLQYVHACLYSYVYKGSISVSVGKISIVFFQDISDHYSRNHGPHLPPSTLILPLTIRRISLSLVNGDSSLPFAISQSQGFHQDHKSNFSHPSISIFQAERTCTRPRYLMI